MSKQKLIKRLESYYPMEKFHAFITFPAITIMVISFYPLKEVLFLVYGLLLIIFILIQGQRYWKLKLYRLTDKYFDQEKNLKYFKIAKKINTFLIVLIPEILLLQFYFNDWQIGSKNLLIFGLIANVFGILEHINYYYRQLTIDKKSDLDYLINYKRLKVASLAKDLMENQI